MNIKTTSVFKQLIVGICLIFFMNMCFAGEFVEKKHFSENVVLNKKSFNETPLAVTTSERQALIDLYNGTDGDSWTSNSGWKEPPLHVDGFSLPGTETSWSGVIIQDDKVIRLNLSNNNLIGIVPDLSPLEYLIEVNLSNNQISSIDMLDGLTNLKVLNCNYNNLATLPSILTLSNLEELYISNNQITSLPDLDGLSSLKWFDCRENLLSSLPGLSGLTSIEYLYCMNNQLTSLPPLAGLSTMIMLGCRDNDLTSLPPLTGLTSLTHIFCNSNQLTSLPDLTVVPTLEVLWCHVNQLTSLPSLTGLTQLREIICYGNQLNSLPDFAGLTSLESVECQYNNLESLPELAGLSSLKKFYCFSNALTTLPELTGLSSLEYFYCDDNQLTELPSMTDLVNLKGIRCMDNQLLLLPDLSSLTNLEFLYCEFNRLTGLPDMSALSSLTNMRCNYNYFNFDDCDQIRILEGKGLSTLEYNPQGNDYNLDCDTGGGVVTITSTSGDFGTIYQEGNVDIYSGSKQTFFIVPDENCHIKDVLVDGISVGILESFTFNNVLSDRSISAVFEHDNCNLTMNVATGSGTVTPSGTTIHPYNSEVAIQANPSTGYSFNSWSGDFSSADNPDTITMTSDMNISANFEISKYTVTVSSTSGGSTDRDGSNTVNHGDTITITPSPINGYHFTEWTGDASGNTTPLTLNVTSNMTITANFEINKYTVNISSTPGGSTDKDGNNTLNHGDTITITPSPLNGYHFTEWSGDASGNTTPLTLTVTSNMTITANFEINNYTVAVASTSGGSTDKDGNNTVNHGDTITITPSPINGYHFTEWTGDSSGNITPLTLTVTSNLSITANFEINNYTVNVSSTSGGSTDKDGSNTVNHGDIITITPSPISGYHFTEWTGDASGSTTPLTLTVTSNMTITANFGKNEFTVTVSSASGGSTDKDGTNIVNEGDTITITPSPQTGYHFTEWTGDASGSTTPLTLTVSADMTVTANFEINNYTVTVSSSFGGSTDKDGSHTITHGDTITITPTPINGYHFTEWTGDASGNTSPLILTVTSNMSITANFGINEYTVTVTSSSGGSTDKEGNNTVNHGDTITITPSPLNGYHFTEWAGDASGITTPLTLTVTSNMSITANFGINEYTVTVSSSSGGSTDQDGTHIVTQGETITITPSPYTGCHFTEWTGDASGSTTPLTLTVTSDLNVTANFEVDTFIISVISGSNGSTNADGSNTLDYGESFLVKFYCDAGYLVDTVTVDGILVEPKSFYKFTDISDNHTLIVTFKADELPVIDSFTANPDSGFTPLDVLFTLIAHDPDNSEIVSYHWDFDGNDIVDKITDTGSVTHRYYDEEVYYPKAYVQDEQGNKVLASGPVINGLRPYSLILSNELQSPKAVIPGKMTEPTVTIDTPSFTTNNWIINMTNSENIITLEGLDSDGNITERVTITQPAYGKDLVSFSLFSSENTLYSKMKTTHRSSIACTIMSEFSRMASWLQVPLENTFFIPHIAEETDFWDSFSVISLSEERELSFWVNSNECKDEKTFVSYFNLNNMVDGTNSEHSWGTVHAHDPSPCFMESNVMSGYEMFIKKNNDGAAIELSNQGSELIYIPHIPTETDLFWTGFTFLNTTQEDVFTHISFYNSEGDICGEYDLNLEPGEKLKGLIEELFEGVSGTAEWGKIEASGKIIALELYGTYDSGICGYGLPVTPVKHSVLPIVMTGEDWWNGVSVTNPNDISVEVTITIRNGEGDAIKQNIYAIPARGKLKGTLNELFLNVQFSETDYIEVTAYEGVLPVQVSGTNNWKYMQAIGAVK